MQTLIAHYSNGTRIQDCANRSEVEAFKRACRNYDSSVYFTQPTKAISAFELDC